MRFRGCMIPATAAVLAPWCAMAGEVPEKPQEKQEERRQEEPREKHPERWYQDECAKRLGGTTEHRVENGRVDILTDTHAIEVEFAGKWKNAIGQSLWYALQTGKPAGIILIVQDENADRGHVIRLGSVISANSLPIKLWVWPDDFR